MLTAWAMPLRQRPFSSYETSRQAMQPPTLREKRPVTRLFRQLFSSCETSLRAMAMPWHLPAKRQHLLRVKPQHLFSCEIYVSPAMQPEKPLVTAKTLARSLPERSQKPAKGLGQIFSCSCGRG